MKKCALCKSTEIGEDAPILVMSVLGVPRYLCDGCNSDMETVTLGRDYEKIREAMERIGEKLSSSSPDDLTLETVDSVLRDSAERAKMIKDGRYDFSLDEQEESTEASVDYIPDEFLETDEDKELDRRDEEKQKKFDKVFNLITVAVGLAAVGLIIYKLIERFAS